VLILRTWCLLGWSSILRLLWNFKFHYRIHNSPPSPPVWRLTQHFLTWLVFDDFMHTLVLFVLLLLSISGPTSRKKSAWVRFEVLAATSMKMAVFWDVEWCSLIVIDQIDRRFHLPDDGVSKLLNLWRISPRLSFAKSRKTVIFIILSCLLF
jgi:hypothetical protein